jgi:gas vesicle protein
MEHENNTGNIIAGLLIGTAIGATLGILFAPDKGVRTRKKILHKSDELTDGLTKKLDEFIDTVQKEYGKAKERAAEPRDKLLKTL